jgi:poly(3-hydroxybutyrate) depolymerase
LEIEVPLRRKNYRLIDVQSAVNNLYIKQIVRKKGDPMKHKYFLIPVCIVFLAISGFTQTTVTMSFTVSGTTHSCVIHVPSGINKPALVFFVHGATGSGPAFESETKGDATADREKFIAVYPSASSNGTSGTWADMQGTTNFPFFLAVIDTVDNRYHIDRNKVYMTGFSQGGMISFVASCSYANVFAAVAPVSGHSNTTCPLKRPISVFMTFGTQDIGATSTFLADLNIWLKLDTCPSTPTITRPYPASSPNSGVTRITYGPCAQGTYVVADSILGEGHQWPDASRLNQADEVWTFFKQFSLNGATTIHQQQFAMAREPLSASYASGTVRLTGVKEKCKVRVFDVNGRLVAAAAVTHGQFAFTDKPSGVYMAMVNGMKGPVQIKMILP